MRNIPRSVVMAVTVGLVASLPLALVLSGPANANTLNNGGPATLTTIGSVTTGSPYSSGQDVTITVAANSTLSFTNLETAGYTGEPAMKAEECVDPGGLVVNLPATPTGNCDGQTIASTSAVNADGSWTITPFPVYALPDNPTFGETTGPPTCGTAPNYCVLYLGPAQSDFSKPHIFSAPFLVTANDDDGAENPGDGTPEAPLVIGLPLLGMAVGGSALYLRRRRQSHTA
jgi:hypothetical protein